MKLLDNGNLELLEGSGILYLQMYNGMNGTKCRDTFYINKEQLKEQLKLLKDFSETNSNKCIKFGVSDKLGIYEITMDNGEIVEFNCVES